MSSATLGDLEDAEQAYQRIHAELEALPASELATMNVDLISARSLVLGVVETIHRYRVVTKIKLGSGDKDAASDLVALVALYRSKWDDVKSMCGVTEQDLRRGSEIGTAMFAQISRREFQTATMSNGVLRVRRAWTLLDRSYRQCQRVGHNCKISKTQKNHSIASSLSSKR